MSDWKYAQDDPGAQLAQLHYFSVTRQQDDGDVEFVITVKEYAAPKEELKRFVARSDKQTNQEIGAYTPCGWGPTLLKALTECIREIHRFPYQGPR
jgi:hypothetical protein